MLDNGNLPLFTRLSKNRHFGGANATLRVET